MTYWKQLLLLLFIFSGINTNAQEYNIPPGSILKSKVNTQADYWHKLSEIPNESPNKIISEEFIEMSESELLEYKTTSIEKYDYYVDAKNFYKELSNRVKVVFTKEELWDIYMFNPELKTKLSSIE